MYRIAHRQIQIPEQVELSRDGDVVTVKGPKGELGLRLHSAVRMLEEDGKVHFDAAPEDIQYAGTMNALFSNNIKGIMEGFEKSLNWSESGIVRR